MRQTSSSNFTLLSFSSTTQRQLAGEPTGSSPLWLSPTILITDHTQLPARIPAQSMWTKQSQPSLTSSFDWLPPLYRNPHQTVNLLDRLELRLNYYILHK